MTIEELCIDIEFETHTRTWAEAPPALRHLVIRGFIEQFMEAQAQVNIPAEEAAKKVVKRKPRKAKAAPLTQHAEAVDY